MFCVKADVSAVTLESLKLEDLLEFFTSVQNMKRGVVQCVKGFMRYLRENNIIEQDLCLDCIKPYKYREEKIPSYHSMVVSVSVKVIWSSVHTFEG